MKIAELITERRQQNTELVYHGTSSNFVRSILKTGLSPTPSKRSWGDKDAMGASKESLHGVYLTPDIRYGISAADRATEVNDGTPVLITIQYVSGSGGLDEDNITGAICYAVAENYNSFIDNFDHQFPYLVSAIKEKLTGVTLNNRSIQLLKHLTMVAVAITSENYDEVDSLEFKSILSDPKFRQLLTQFTESVKVHPVTKKWPINIKVTRPIGFSGKTCIIKIEDLQTNAIYYSQQK